MGHRYFYKIAAFNEIEGTIVCGEQSFSLNAIPSLAQVESVKTKQKSYNKMKITWEETGGADGYIVYLSDKKDDDYQIVKRIGVTEVTDEPSEEDIKCSATLSKLTTGKKYYVKVQACKILDGKLKVGEESDAVEFSTNLTQVKNVVVEPDTYQSLSLTWDEVKGAKSYEILRTDVENGKYEKIATVKDTSYVDEELVTGTTYFYKVRAVRTTKKITAKGKSSEVQSETPILDVPTAPTAGTVSQLSIELKLEATDGADGYYIERSTSESDGFEQVADYTDLEKMDYVDSDLKENTSYYYRVIAYKNLTSEDEEVEEINKEEVNEDEVEKDEVENAEDVEKEANIIQSETSEVVKITTKKFEVKPVDIKAGTAVEYATSRVGCSYVWGASGPNTFDCSGLVMWSYKKAGGRSLPHNAQAQYNCTTHISSADLQPGDLVFYGGSTSSINHVAIYIGNGKVVHAANPSSGVKYSKIGSASSSRIVGYSRV
jgi:hypothetical protein